MSKFLDYCAIWVCGTLVVLLLAVLVGAAGWIVFVAMVAIVWLSTWAIIRVIDSYCQ